MQNKKFKNFKSVECLTQSLPDTILLIGLFRGLDIKWRKNLVEVLKPKKPEKILDVATAQDLAIALGETLASEIIGIDISEQMLEIGKKVERNQLQKNIKMEIGDGEKINYPNNYFDAVTVSFGVRNFEKSHKGLEIYRVPQTRKRIGYFGNIYTSKFSVKLFVPFVYTLLSALNWLIFFQR